jgi:membrane-anchored protein YejM (alkaline phosphatase superfamily)
LTQKESEKKKEDDKYQRELQEFTDWHEESKKWIERLRLAKTRKQYDSILRSFKQMRSTFKKKFKNCLPPPPPTMIVDKIKNSSESKTEKHCHDGY